MYELDGRATGIVDNVNPFGKVNLFKVSHINGNGYTGDGNYWGVEYRALYCCMVMKEGGNNSCIFIPANTRDEAKKHVVAVLGPVRFFV